MRSYLTVSVVLLAALPSLVSAEEAFFHFTGTVQRGQDFLMELPDGLVFRLNFIDYGPEGWSIRINDPAGPDENFCAVVTPPYRGINALQIYAWHFFNDSFSGPNDGSVNAPGEERHFSFVTDRLTYGEAFALLSSMMWPEDPEDAEEAALAHDAVPRRDGSLTITDLSTGSIPGTDSVWIEYMDFEVDLYLE